MEKRQNGTSGLQSSSLMALEMPRLTIPVLPLLLYCLICMSLLTSSLALHEPFVSIWRERLWCCGRSKVVALLSLAEDGQQHWVLLCREAFNWAYQEFCFCPDIVLKCLLTVCGGSEGQRHGKIAENFLLSIQRAAFLVAEKWFGGNGFLTLPYLLAITQNELRGKRVL